MVPRHRLFVLRAATRLTILRTFDLVSAATFLPYQLTGQRTDQECLEGRQSQSAARRINTPEGRESVPNDGTMKLDDGTILIHP